MIQGCDISHWQGKRIDFNKMKAAGADFVVIKATDFNMKTGVDDCFLLNAVKAKEAGLLVGAYHWWLPESKYGVIEQAALFYSVVGDICDLPPVLDVEVGGNPKSLWTARLYAMCRHVENYFKRRPIIYTSNYIWKGNSINYGWAKNYPLWIAHYKVDKPTIPLPWDKWAIWQYSCVGPGQTYGINIYDGKAVDLNYFNGTLAELKAL